MANIFDKYDDEFVQNERDNYPPMAETHAAEDAARECAQECVVSFFPILLHMRNAKDTRSEEIK